MSKIKVYCEKITTMKSEKKISDSSSCRQEKPLSRNNSKESIRNSTDIKNKITPMTSELKSVGGKKTGK